MHMQSCRVWFVRTIAVVALASLVPAAVAQAVLRVPEQYGTIQSAVNAATDGDTVLVGPGYYMETFRIDADFQESLTIRSTSGPFATVIDAQRTGSVVWVLGWDSTLRIEGFTLKDGHSGAPGRAGGLNANGGRHLELRDCVFEGNSASYWGSALGVSTSGTVTVENCRFTENTVIGFGTISVSGSPGPEVVVRNSELYGNVGDGCIAFVDTGSLTLEGCTIAGNSGQPQIERSIFPSDIVIRNSIIRTEGQTLIWGGGGVHTLTIEHSNIEGGADGPGNIDADPLFVDSGAGNFRLLADSPCIDSGDSTGIGGGIFQGDYVGLGRVVNDPTVPDTGVPDALGGVIDMGAHEFQSDCDSDGVFDGAAVAEAFPGAGSSLRLDGINDHAIVEGFIDIPTHESTIEFWAYTPLWDIQAPFGFWDCDQPSQRMLVHLPWADGFVYWQHGDIDTQWYAELVHKSSPLPSRQGRWTHWAFVTEPSTNTTRIYHDGKVVEVRGGWGIYGGGDVPLMIGDRGNPADGCSTAPFRGMIDEFRVWSVARSEAEIAASLAVPLAGDEVGLLAYYTFDEGVGSTSANLCLGFPQPDAELRNGASWHIPSEIDRNQNGIVDGCEDCNNNGRPDGTEFGAFEGTEWAIEFDGDGARADSTEAPDFSIAGQSFTVESWVFRREATGQEEYFFFHGTEGVANQGLVVGFRADGRFTCAFWANDLETLRPIEPDGQWHHWACTYDATTNARRIYVDGDLIASDTASADFAGTGPIRVGGLASRAYFNGTLDEIRLWDHARTESEIEADMFRSFTNGPIPPELHAYWPGETPLEGYLLDYAGDNDLLPGNGSEWEYFFGSDCNGNGVPDECDPDSDGDGIPDDCDCAADFNNDGNANTLDVLAFLNAWTAGDPSADMNGDGTVNTLDVLVFLNLWTAGC